MVFGIGDELSVRISAQTQDFERGISSAERSLTGLVDNAASASGALQVLAGRADNASDQLNETARSASITTGAFSALSVGTSGLNINFSALSTTTIATLIPALGALLATLVPLTATVATLTAGFAALAGAFGLVIGAGFLAFGEKLSNQQKERLKNLQAEQNALERTASRRESAADALEENLESLQSQAEELRNLRAVEGELSEKQKETLANLEERIETRQNDVAELRRTAQAESERVDKLDEQIKKTEEATTITGALGKRFAELRDELIPIISEFGQKFIPLIEDALNAIPGLVKEIIAAIGGAERFGNVLRRFGVIIANVLPGLAALAVSFAEDLLPVVENFIGFLESDGADIMAAFGDTTDEVVPLLASLGDSFVEALPAINEFGITVLRTIVPALSDAISFVGDFLAKFNAGEFDSEISKIETIVNNVSSAFVEFLPLLRDIAELAQAELIPRIVRLSQNIRELAPTIARIAGQVLPPFIAGLFVLIDAVNFVIEAFNSLSPQQQALAFIAIASAVAILSGGVLGVVAAIAAATAIVNEFGDDAMRIFNDVKQFILDIPDALTDAFRGGINKVIGFLNFLARGAAEIFEGIGNVAIDALNGVIERIRGIIKTLPKELKERLGIDLSDVQKAERLDFVAPQIDRLDPANDIAQSRQQDQRVVVELKDELLEGKIREGAGEVVNRQDRRLNRNV